MSYSTFSLHVLLLLATSAATAAGPVPPVCICDAVFYCGGIPSFFPRVHSWMWIDIIIEREGKKKGLLLLLLAFRNRKRSSRESQSVHLDTV